jgi:DNA-binding MarR family transcriptional regulator
VLADHLFLERATVSVLAHRLVEAGFLVRLPGENRRTHLLAITETAGALLNTLGPQARSLADTTLEAFSTTELQLLEEHLKRLEVRLRADAETHPP